MATLKRDALYVDLWLAQTELIDRGIKAFLAIAASSSIGGWLIFQQYAFLWAAIVAASQVLQAVKEYLPYKNRLKALAGLSVDLNALCLVAEDQWYRVSNGTEFDDDIHDLRMQLKRKKLAALQKTFPVAGLPKKAKLVEKADAEAEQYFSSYQLEG
ncbi:hypothetical protein [Bradyrhizobium sp. JR3.5]